MSRVKSWVEGLRGRAEQREEERHMEDRDGLQSRQEPGGLGSGMVERGKAETRMWQKCQRRRRERGHLTDTSSCCSDAFQSY